MNNFCPDCSRLTASVLANPEVSDKPSFDEDTGEVKANIGVSLHCAACGHQFVEVSFELEGMVSDYITSEHCGDGHEIELDYGNPTLTENGTGYELTLPIDVQCSCPEDEHALESVELERTLTEEEIQEALE